MINYAVVGKPSVFFSASFEQLSGICSDEIYDNTFVHQICSGLQYDEVCLFYTELIDNSPVSKASIHTRKLEFQLKVSPLSFFYIFQL